MPVLPRLFCHTVAVPELGRWSEAVFGNLLASRDLNFSWFLQEFCVFRAFPLKKQRVGKAAPENVRAEAGFVLRAGRQQPGLRDAGQLTMMFGPLGIAAFSNGKWSHCSIVPSCVGWDAWK